MPVYQEPKNHLVPIKNKASEFSTLIEGNLEGAPCSLHPAMPVYQEPKNYLVSMKIKASKFSTLIEGNNRVARKLSAFTQFFETMCIILSHHVVHL